MFAGSLLIGLRAQAPVEQSRRRQLEFTADASHELRTPLSVIRAETDLALASPREAADYRDTLIRIRGESERLRQLVEDMLWLARFDSEPPPPGDEGRSTWPRSPRPAPTGSGRSARRSPRPSASRARADQRAARVDRPAGRGAAGQRLPLRRPGGQVRIGVTRTAAGSG